MKENYEALVNTVYTIRGQVINEIIFLERHIDKLLAKHFCDNPKKEKLLMETIFCTNRITFESKRQVLQFIYEKEWGKLFFKELKELIEHRNVFAHYILDTSPRGLKENKKVCFIKFSNSEEDVWYELSKIKSIVKTTGEKIQFVLNELKK